MKILCLLSLFLISCVKFTSTAPWAHPNPDTVTCNADICCYPTSNGTQVCATNGLFGDKPNIYYLVIKY